jgi:AMMECR1 domain-containing protein
LYLDWLIIWSSWNIKEIEDNIVLELIYNTIWALKDSRFTTPIFKEKDNIKIRIDEITNRWRPLEDWEIKKIDPAKNWVLVIKTDYEKSATILPNISWKLLTWEDFIPVLSKKLDEEFVDTNYLVYKIETKIYSDIK